MLELTEIPQTSRERIQEIGAADLVIGIFSAFSPPVFEKTVAGIRESVSRLYTPARTVIVHSGEQIAAPLNDVRILPLPALQRDLTADPAYAAADTYHGLFAVSDAVHARAIAVIVSDLDTVTDQWIYRLIRPVLELDFDLVVPCYSHTRFEGLLNSGIVAPFTRALYGRRIHHPLGPDFGFSARFAAHLLAKASRRRDGARSLASIAVDALCDGFEVSQSHVGARRYPAADWMNQSSVLSQILGPVFHEAEVHAPFWQRLRGSQPVPNFGEPSVHDQRESTAGSIPESFNIARMIESFHLGLSNLQEIWGLVLPPGTLLELSRLTRLAPEQFRMPDHLWARVLYDFALGYRLRTISQDHLIRAMTPLYLAWVASHILELTGADEAAVEQRLERLALAFEASKPYVLSRWRWPDRFNP
jgi:hypothetical protein